MTISKKIVLDCILLKIESLFIITTVIVGISYLFSNSYIYDLTILDMGFIGVVALIPLFWWFGELISTNNPNTRFNVFSINYKWLQRINQTTRLNLFGLSPADPNYHQKIQRVKNIANILE